MHRLRGRRPRLRDGRGAGVEPTPTPQDLLAAARPAPLAGVLVVDLTRHLPGPLSAQLLADLGARVIKIEEPRQGDPIRQAPPSREGTGTLAALLLSGTESVALDLKQPAGKEVLERLLARADVVLEGFRPGTLARLGFAPDLLLQRHPRLVVCSLSGFGATGPYAPRAGHDLTYQALAGTLAPSGGAMPAVPLADLTGSWSALAAILAALYERERTGEGRLLDASLFDAASHANLIGWAAEGVKAHRVGEPLALTGALPCYNLYRTADNGWLAIATLEGHFWERFCTLVEREDLKGRPYSQSPKVKGAVADLVRAKTRDEWARLLAEVDLPIEIVLSAEEARRHPQAIERGVLREGGDGLVRLGFPVRFGGERPEAGDAFPELGGDTDRVLEELGLPKRGHRGRHGVGQTFSLRRMVRRWMGR